MDFVTTGSLLANRYRLMNRAESDLAGIEAWSAKDQILDRPVRVELIKGPRASMVLDEARRAALVTDPRLVRIVDVGSRNQINYVVTEPHQGDDLSILTSIKPLAPDQARAIIGEVAVALDIAQKRGMHHMALRPQAIRIVDGRVQVTGLGTDGALNPGLGKLHPTASRTDAVGLVSLLFYALTTKWPSDSLDALSLAPGIRGPETTTEPTHNPRDLEPEIPTDLVQLCTTTLPSRTAGPRTSSEVASALEPWGPITAVMPGIFSGVTTQFEAEMLPNITEVVVPEPHPTQEPTPPDTDPSPTSVRRQSVRSTFESSGTPVRAGTPPPANPSAEPGRVPRRSVLGTASPSAVSPSVPQPASAPPGASPGSSSTLQPGPTPSPSASPMPPVIPPRTGQAPTTSVPSAPTPRPGSGYAAAQAGQGTPTTPMKFDELVASPREYRRFRFNPTVLTLLLALVAVLFGVYWALTGLTEGLTNPFADRDISRPVLPDETEDETESGDTEPDETEAPAPAPEPVIAPIIVSGQQLDPQGDNNEHPEAVDLAFDQDPSTYWFTRTYNSPTFQGMGREGIGFAVKLENAAPVSTVYLSTNNEGGQVEIRATDPSTPTKGKILASGPLSDEADFELSETVETQNIVLWFTELPKAPGGINRVELREITLT